MHRLAGARSPGDAGASGSGLVDGGHSRLRAGSIGVDGGGPSLTLPPSRRAAEPPSRRAAEIVAFGPRRASERDDPGRRPAQSLSTYLGRSEYPNM
jgi:hypothetical protein